MSDSDNFGTVLLNLDSLVENNTQFSDLFDDEGKQMARRIFGEGIAPYINDTAKSEKAEKINVAVRMLARELK